MTSNNTLYASRKKKRGANESENDNKEHFNNVFL